MPSPCARWSRCHSRGLYVEFDYCRQLLAIGSTPKCQLRTVRELCMASHIPIVDNISLLEQRMIALDLSMNGRTPVAGDPAEQIARALEQDIVLGHLRPGERLREEEL